MSDVSVPAKDVAAIEEKIKAEQATAQEKIHAEAKDTIRKEFETEARLKEAEAKASQPTEQLKTLQEQLEQVKKSNDELLAKKVDERIAEVEAKRKAFVPQSLNPFEAPKKVSPIEGMTLDRAKAIEQASYEAFLAKASRPQ